MSLRATAQDRVGIVERLHTRRAEIDEAIFARVSDQWFDRTGSDDPKYVAGLRAAGVTALDYVLTGVERSGEFVEPVPTAVLEQARRAARVGVGLETVLRRYLAGYAMLQRFVIQEVERGGVLGRRSALCDVLGIISALVDRLITAVSSAYNKEIGQGNETALASEDVQVLGRRNGGAVRARADVDREGSMTKLELAAQSQRERIMYALAEVTAERSFAGTSVKLVTARAGVSSRTFYEEYGGLQECFLAVLDLALERVSGLIEQAVTREERWQDGVLGALASLLVCFDSEPALTRIWFVEALAAGTWALERREHIAGILRLMILDCWAARGEEPPDPAVAAGVIATVLGLIQTHMITERPEPLIELLGPLMGLVTSFYLETHDRAPEVERAAKLAREIQAAEVSWTLATPSQSELTLPATLTNLTARRLHECIIFLAEQGGRGLCPGNREIGTAIGVGHKSQISKLLLQLQAEDLAVKRSVGPGRRNEWRLTSRGEEIAHGLKTSSGPFAPPPRASQSASGARRARQDRR